MADIADWFAHLGAGLPMGLGLLRWYLRPSRLAK